VVAIRRLHQLQQMIDRILISQIGAADELIERGQGRRQLRNIDSLAINEGNERTEAARVGRILEPELPLQLRQEAVDLPSGCPVYPGRPTKHFGELITRKRQLAPGPGRARLSHPVLPLHVIVRVNADLEAPLGNAPHDVSTAAADVRSRKQSPVEEGLDAVVLDHGSPPDLTNESASERAPNRPAGVVGPKTEQKSGTRLRTLQKRSQSRDSFASAAVSVHVNFQRDETHGIQYRG
jgi:hypothetical protein